MSANPSPSPAAHRAALSVAHPGHELVVHAWMHSVRPTVFVLTDGSGRSGEDRSPSTVKNLEAAAAPRGALFSRYRDVVLYEALLKNQITPFVHLAEELAGHFEEGGIDFVVGDAYEGYNPLHDLSCVITHTAARLAGGGNASIEHYEYFLFRRHDSLSQDDSSAEHVHVLTDGEYDRKLAAARDYAGLADEINAVMSGRLKEFVSATGIEAPADLLAMDLSAYRVEAFRLARPYDFTGPRFYDMYGRAQVERGIHAAAILYDRHVRPVEQALLAL